MQLSIVVALNNSELLCAVVMSSKTWRNTGILHVKTMNTYMYVYQLLFGKLKR